MKLITIGSDSSGNCYLLRGRSETLILEAGVKYKEVIKALDYDISSVVGAVVSHEHGDHAKSVDDYLSNGIVTLANSNVLRGKHSSFAGIISAGQGYILGGFRILPFEAKHDVPCFGFIIEHSEMGKLLFLTDTMYSEYTFKGLNHILVECNYCDHVLDKNIESGTVHESMRGRLLNTHMELKTTKNLLKSNDLSNVKNIVLIHLSKGNSDIQYCKDEIEKSIGLPIYIASKGLELELEK